MTKGPGIGDSMSPRSYIFLDVVRQGLVIFLAKVDLSPGSTSLNSDSIGGRLPVCRQGPRRSLRLVLRYVFAVVLVVVWVLVIDFRAREKLQLLEPPVSPRLPGMMRVLR